MHHNDFGMPTRGSLDAFLIKVVLTHEDTLERWAIYGRDRSPYCDGLQSCSCFGDFRKVLIFLRGQQAGPKLFLDGFQELIWEVHHASWNSAAFFYNVTAKIVSKRVAWTWRGGAGEERGREEENKRTHHTCRYLGRCTSINVNSKHTEIDGEGEMVGAVKERVKDE